MGCSRPLTAEERPGWSQGAQKVAGISDELSTRASAVGRSTMPTAACYRAATDHSDTISANILEGALSSLQASQVKSSQISSSREVGTYVDTIRYDTILVD